MIVPITKKKLNNLKNKIFITKIVDIHFNCLVKKWYIFNMHDFNMILF